MLRTENRPANKIGEPHGRADSFPRCSNADSGAHRSVSRGPLHLPERQALATLFSNATRLSLLRYGARAGRRAEPEVSIISPSSGGIPVAFGVRDALNAEQIYWAEQEQNKRQFRQYVQKGEVNPCIIVDDIIRSGHAIEETIELVKTLGARIIGCGAIVRFDTAPDEVEGGPIKSLMDFDVKMYEGDEDCAECKEGVTPEHVRF